MSKSPKAGKSILLATPLKGGLSPEYFKAWANLMSGALRDYKFGWCFVAGTAVMAARDEIADNLLRQNYDELVFWDKDLRLDNVEILRRLLSHKEPIVCAPYCRTNLDTHWHFQFLPNEPIRPNGLIKVLQSAIGCCKIDAEVFITLKKKFPERAYTNRETGKEAVSLHQFFPHEVIGPTTALGKYERIVEAMNAAEPLNQIRDIIADRDHSRNMMIGEDYRFCQLVTEAGYEIFIDTKCIVPHVGDCNFPIDTDDLKRMLAEPWRNPPLWPDDYGVAGDHCADVLQGCYDIPWPKDKPITILDVGANIGAFARWADGRFDKPTLHCYEPHPGNFALLKRTAATLKHKPQLHQNAVAHHECPFAMFNSGKNCGEWALRPGSGTKEELYVQAVDASSLPKADFFKLDVEGAELDILRRLNEVKRLHDFTFIALEYHSASYLPEIYTLLDPHFRQISRRDWAEHRGVIKFQRKS